MESNENIDKKELTGYLTAGKRIIFEGGVYHITQRAPGREVVFLEESDYLYFLKTLKDVAQEYRLKIYCFALLTNHLHLLLEISEKNLSQAMKSLFGTYAKFFNKKYGRKGHVFCGRFRASVCYDQTYFLVASAYIHLNPLRANLCTTLRGYRWSTVHLYIDNPRETFVEFQKILSFLDKDQGKASRMYEEMLYQYAAKKGKVLVEQRDFRKVFKDGIRFLHELTPHSGRNGSDLLGNSCGDKKRLISIESQRGRKYSVIQLLASGYTYPEIQSHLKISRATLYRILNSTSR